jgi:hypothetical protein
VTVLAFPRVPETSSGPWLRLVGVLALLAGSGCVGPAFDLCVPEADSVRVVHVQPPTRPGPDNGTVAGTFASIQDALDAVGGDRGRATVCVADGTYFEELTVPADTHLVAAGAVRVRPPQTREAALPTKVDRVLLTLETGPEGPIVLDGFDLRRGGLCVDVKGDGAAVLRDTAIVDCAVGLRGRGGDVTLHEVMLENHSIRGLDLVTTTLRTESGTTVLRNGRPELGHEQAALTELDPDLGWIDGLAPGRGALIAVDSDVTLADTTVNENEYVGGLLDVTGGTLTLRDVEIAVQRAASNPEGFVSGDAGGDGPIVAATDATVDVDGLLARSARQGLFQLVGSDLRAVNVDWSGRALNTTPEGAPGPVVDAADGGSVLLWHASVLGPEGAPGIRVGGSEVIPVEVANSIVWGHGGGAGVAVDGADPTLTLRYSLFEDAGVVGNQMVSAVAPGWDEDPEGVLRLDPTSPARCRGAGDLDVAVDLLGNPRPFEPDKAPDLGALELQQACP